MALELNITKKYNKYGVIDSNGNVLVKHSYDKIYKFDENFHSVVNNYNGKFGVIDINNNIVLDIIYNKISDFKYKLAIVSIKNKVGLIDNSYKVLLKAQYDKIEYDHNDVIKITFGNKVFTLSKASLLNKLP